MFKISIVPDTNVLLSNLDILKGLYGADINVTYTINYSKIVLDELDGLKKNKVAARNAITFIGNVSKLFKTEIEGRTDDRKMDVVVEQRELSEGKTNDDKILNYCLKLENPILLSNDKVFLLKSESYNVKGVNVSSKSLNAVVDEIHQAIGFGNVEVRTKVTEAYRENLKNGVRNAIGPVIEEILVQELGLNYFLVFSTDSSLEYYLEFVRANFFIFQKYLPAKSPSILKEFEEAIRTRQVSDVKQMAKVVCLLFRVQLPEKYL